MHGLTGKVGSNFRAVLVRYIFVLKKKNKKKGEGE
jgi:hypothetical protein